MTTDTFEFTDLRRRTSKAPRKADPVSRLFRTFIARRFRSGFRHFHTPPPLDTAGQLARLRGVLVAGQATLAKIETYEMSASVQLDAASYRLERMIRSLTALPLSHEQRHPDEPRRVSTLRRLLPERPNVASGANGRAPRRH